MEVFSRFVSYVFNPLVAPTALVAIVFATNSYLLHAMGLQAVRSIFLIVAVNTMIIPVLLTLILLRRRGKVNIDMPQNTERRLPILIGSIFYIASYYLMHQFQLPQTIISVMFGCALSLVAAFMVNVFWKISLHMIALGGLLGGTLAMGQLASVNVLYLTMSISIIAGLVATARMYLQAHNGSQLAAGFILGGGIMFQVIHLGLG